MGDFFSRAFSGDGDSDGKGMLILVLAAVAVFGGILTTYAIVTRTAASTARARLAQYKTHAAADAQ